MALYEVDTLALVIGDSNERPSRLRKVSRCLEETVEQWTMGILTVTDEYRWLYGLYGPANAVRLMVVVALYEGNVYVQPHGAENVFYLLTENRRRLFLDDQQ